MPLKDLEQRRIYAKQYYAKNREHLLAYGRQNYAQNRERYLRQAKEWEQNNRVKARAAKRAFAYRLRYKILTHYGNGKCACVKCGESRLACLSIDHIKGGGREHRRNVKHFYSWLKRNNYPTGYQTLCMNCQFVKRVENGEIKHIIVGETQKATKWIARSSALVDGQ